MNWITDRLVGRKQPPHAEWAEKLYQALVLGGGPSSEAQDHIDATSLSIPLGLLERFANKRLISLEALLFVAVQIETAEQSSKLQDTLGDAALHPLAIEIGKAIVRRWEARGIEMNFHDVGDHCFAEVESFSERPFAWGRKWLEEFYDDDTKAGEHYILWTQQWMKEFSAMRTVVRNFS